jgi:arginine deiminase
MLGVRNPGCTHPEGQRPTGGVESSVVSGRFVASEVGRLRTVILYRPGGELARLTPRNNDELLFDGIPWVERAQEEHDAFAEALRDHGVEVIDLRNLLTDVCAIPEARAELLDAALRPQVIGPGLAAALRDHFDDADATTLSAVLTDGLSHDELPVRGGLVDRMAGARDFIIRPLANLLFTRDSSVWLEHGVAVTHLALPARRRESSITAAVYRHHPRFAGTEILHGGGDTEEAWLEGGDVLILSPGVLAIGVGQRTNPAGVEIFARKLFENDDAHTVLAVPISQDRATMHLDTVCTMVDRDLVVMYPAIAGSLQAYVIEPGGQCSDAQPFLTAAAKAMAIDKLRVIDTGLDPVTAEREQWDDGNNTLALAPGVVVAYERNRNTNARLEEHGVTVVAVSGSELGTGRGGPRCMSCPVSRDPL